MQTHVIISYDGTDNDHDALALGAIFGDAGARVSLAYVRHATEPDAAAERAAQAHAARQPLDQGHARLGLERRDLLRDRRLRVRQRLGCGGERAVVGDGDEDPQTVDVEH